MTSTGLFQLVSVAFLPEYALFQSNATFIGRAFSLSHCMAMASALSESDYSLPINAARLVSDTCDGQACHKCQAGYLPNSVMENLNSTSAAHKDGFGDVGVIYHDRSVCDPGELIAGRSIVTVYCHMVSCSKIIMLVFF